MINWLKSIWRKLFKKEEKVLVVETLHRNPDGTKTSRFEVRPAYDPSEDEHKIMSGEIESYFD